MILGDSLSAAYGIPVESGWVHLLDQKLQQQAFDYRVVNASISGETTAGAMSRLPAILERVQADVCIIELGANDGLRGFPPDLIRNNLESLIHQLQDKGTRVVLVQMHIPPNYGPAYTQRFDAIYSDLSEQYSLPLAPFILQDMFDDPTLMQEDGLHPRANAQPLILNHVWPVLKAVVARQ